MPERLKYLNLSDEELEEALITCSESWNLAACETCPYNHVQDRVTGDFNCSDKMLEDAAGRIHNLRKQVDILTKMMKLEDDE